MTKSLLIELAASLGGVGLLVAVSWLLGARGGVRVTKIDAADRLAFDEPDLRIAAWFVGIDEKSAAALSEDGAEIALVFALGDNFATRRLSRRTAQIEQRGSDLRFRLAEPSRRAVTVAAPDEPTARRWLLQLTGAEGMIRA